MYTKKELIKEGFRMGITAAAGMAFIGQEQTNLNSFDISISLIITKLRYQWI